MIEVIEVTKRYGGAVALDALSFAARPGALTGFLGPNGAGKSTTMRLVLGLDRPDAGRILVGGRRYQSYPRPLLVLGSLLEARTVHPGRTAGGHLAWLARTQGIGTQRVEEVLAQVGLADAAGRRVGTYSLGMAQRLGVAAALLGDPDAVMLDEPMNGLDPEGMVWLRRLLRELADQGRTVLVSSHLMSEMDTLCDRLVVIARGRLVADTTPAQLRAGHASLEDAFLALTRFDTGHHGSLS